MKMESVNSLLMLDDKRNPVYKRKREDVRMGYPLFCHSILFSRLQLFS